MSQQDCAAARRGLYQCGEGVEPLALTGAALRLDFNLDAAAGHGKVLGGPEQRRFGRLAIAPGAAGLLPNSLDRLGDSSMRYKAHVWLVDAHPERDRRDYHHVFG